MKPSVAIFGVAICAGLAFSQIAPGSSFRLALPGHKGQLKWTADGYSVVQNSAKPNGEEIGIRASEGSGRLSLLGFLFVAPGVSSLTSTQCRDGMLERTRKDNPGMKVSRTWEITGSGKVPIAVAAYALSGTGTTGYAVRGFAASGDVCGDLEFYSDQPVNDEDPSITKVLSTYELDPGYAPRFGDSVEYAQVLYKTGMYQAAGAAFEKALATVPSNGAPFASAQIARRVVTDQAGLAYGLAGDLAKARAVFEKGIADDPDYPLYYYNLACADAEQKNLGAARLHLRQAFVRKPNLNPGEVMPDPTKDDSFMPYRGDRDFWAFLQGLEAGK